MAGRGRASGFKMPDEHRLKIANSNILSKLIAFAEGRKNAEMEPHRVTAALGLLRKVMPDMTENMLKGDAGAPVVTRIELVAAGHDDDAG